MINTTWIMPPVKMDASTYATNCQLFRVVSDIVAEVNTKIVSAYDDPGYWMDVR